MMTNRELEHLKELAIETGNMLTKEYACIISHLKACAEIERLKAEVMKDSRKGLASGKKEE